MHRYRDWAREQATKHLFRIPVKSQKESERVKEMERVLALSGIDEPVEDNV